MKNEGGGIITLSEDVVKLGKAIKGVGEEQFNKMSPFKGDICENS